jgi:hypothetical protein
MNESPIKADLGANASYQRKRNEIIIDDKTFPPCYDKIEQIGKIKPHKFIIKCDMNKGFHFSEELIPFDEELKKLKKLKDSGVITEEDFNKAKDRILNQL